MLGAVAGDIIGSPYQKKNAEGRDFEMFAGVRARTDGREITYFPKVTDRTLMTLAVARWVMNDPEHKKSTFVSFMQEIYSKYSEYGFSPTMNRWCQSEYAKPFSRDSNDPISRVSPIGIAINDIKEALDAAVIATELTHSHPDCIRGAKALTEAVWLANRGRSKDEIRSTMESEYNLDLSLKEEEMKSILMGGVKEDIMVNGEPTGEYYYRETGKIDYSTISNLTASLKAFLEGDGFEDVVRRAVALGGHSNAIASIAGALACAFYKEIPEPILSSCVKEIPKDLAETMDSFERFLTRKSGEEVNQKVTPHDDHSFHIIKTPDGGKIFVVDKHRKDLIDALKTKFGEDITFIRKAEMAKTYQNLSAQGKDGTYLEHPRPEIRTIYYQDGVFKTAATLEGATLPVKQARMAARQDFCEISEYAKAVKAELQHQVGYNGDGSIHFQNAYYPVISHDKVEIFKGDIFAGSVGIDPNNGLLRIDKGGDFGPMEWFGERTDSVFNSVSFDSIKEAIGRYCLDEGVGIHDSNTRLNIYVANDDVAKSTDKDLHNALEMHAELPRPRIKL